MKLEKVGPKPDSFLSSSDPFRRPVDVVRPTLLLLASLLLGSWSYEARL